jgi:hypothetical protein
MAAFDRTRLRGVERRLLLGALCPVMAVAGCGASRSATTTIHSESARTASQPVPPASIDVSIPTVRREGENYIPKRYTCDGADISLSVRWSRIPPGTAELVISVLNLQPVHGHLFFDWAVAGLSPSSRAIFAGTLPTGVIVGRNSFGTVGYSICPAKGAGEEHYAVRLVALPHRLAIRSGFDAEALYREAERSAKVIGLGGGAYTPPRA